MILNKDDRWALCLSGGCIHSAALRTGYTCFQLLGDAMEGAKTLDDSRLAGTTTPSRPSWLMTSGSAKMASG